METLLSPMEALACLDKIGFNGGTDAIARFLQNEGITGYRCCTGECPVANWLTKQTGSTCLSITQELAIFRMDDMYYKVGVNVANFISAFDNKFYPELSAVFVDC